jgi:nicotinamide-nucleotide amidase
MLKHIEASIITIGDELLIGQVVDTNSSWIATELNNIGVHVKRRVAVGDVKQEIWKALDAEANQTDVILITGGLGPTADDITKPLLCEYFGGKLITNAEVEANIRHIFEVLIKKPLTERNLKQAEVPDCCTVLPNARGTAPGMLFEKEGKIFISMPGVPHEMKGIMTKSVLPLLQQRFELPVIIHKTLVTAGVSESVLADKLVEFEAGLPEGATLAYLPNFSMVRLRLTFIGYHAEDTAALAEEKFKELQSLVKEHMVSDVDQPVQQTVAKLLLERKATMATAESCTGGYIAHLLTSIPGSSAFYYGSVVAYDNSVKQNLLSVDPQTLREHGAVSRETVEEMVDGILKQTNVDYAIAVSGIMGPGGGTEEKPAGTVWIGVGSREQKFATQMFFRFDRKRNIELTAVAALNELRKFILEQKA